MLRLPDMRPLLTILLLLLALTLAGCRAPMWLGPVEAVAWTPDQDRIRALRDSNDLCAHAKLDRPAVRWFVVPGESFIAPSGVEAVGYWEQDHRIFIAAGDTGTNWVLRHELLHASLGAGHPPVFRTCNVMP